MDSRGPGRPPVALSPLWYVRGSLLPPLRTSAVQDHLDFPLFTQPIDGLVQIRPAARDDEQVSRPLLPVIQWEGLTKKRD